VTRYGRCPVMHLCVVRLFFFYAENKMVDVFFRSTSGSGVCKRKREVHIVIRFNQNHTRNKSDGACFCADCQSASPGRVCRNCKRTCWRFCTTCVGYESPRHEHFNVLRVMKKHNASDFPGTRVGRCRCAEDGESTSARCKACQRQCWRWCADCVK